jgi:hypothetical protein
MVPAADRRAEDVAKGGATVRAAIRGYRLTVLLDLLALDSQGEAATGAVDRHVHPARIAWAAGAFPTAIAPQGGTEYNATVKRQSEQDSITSLDQARPHDRDGQADPLRRSTMPA